MLKPSLTLSIVAVTALALAPVRGDVFELQGGGQVTGETIERGEAGAYVVRTDDGVQVTIPRDKLARIVQQSEAQIEYAKRSRAAEDTVEAHRQLVAWCREHGLAAEADRHLSRIVELAPDDEAARKSLGYVRSGKRWLSQEDVNAARGLTMYDGKYRTAQDIAIRKQDESSQHIEVDWFANLRLWCEWLHGRRPDRVEEARARIAAVNDPAATSSVVKLLAKEDDPWVFAMLLDVLGRLDDPLAIETLVSLSLADVSSETRSKCLDYLTAGPRPVSIVPYVLALKSKDNRVVNRAGEALGRIGDSAAISPLIDALVTTHKYQVQAGAPGGMNASFDPNGGGGGFSFGGNGPKTVERTLENTRVLRALTTLSSSQDFGYDQRAWRRWFVDRQMHDRVNSRRDE